MNHRKLLKLCFVAGVFCVLAGCASAPPAPVLESAPDLPVEKPEPTVRRPDTHIIRGGETLIGIALEYGLDYQELALWNGIANPDQIDSGDIIRLSPPASAPQSAPVVRATTSPAPTIAPVSPVAAPSIAAADAATNAATNAAAIVPIAPAPSAAETPAPRGNAPIKDEPVAAKYAYSEQNFKKLIGKPPASTIQNASFTAPPTASAAAPSQTRQRFNVSWSWPVTGKLIGKFSETSKGIDISGVKGNPIYAVADGKVVYTGSGVKSYGRLIILKHENDYLSAYAHNDTILVKEGQQIARGEQISTIGDSGATQPMLHLEIRKSGKPLDPLQVLPQTP